MEVGREEHGITHMGAPMCTHLGEPFCVGTVGPRYLQRWKDRGSLGRGLGCSLLSTPSTSHMLWAGG
jgi:hypothetical protein